MNERRGAWALALACAVSIGCKKQPKEQLVLEDLAPSASAAASVIPALTWLPPWDPALCPPAPEPEGPASFSDLVFDGTCAFHHEGAAACHGRDDDFYITIERKLPNGDPAILYVNVESYTGPGVYDEKAQVVFMIRHGKALYRWANYWGNITLGHGSKGMTPGRTAAAQTGSSTPTSATLPLIQLTAEPGTPASGTISIRGSIGCVTP
jgi:hypothetical protein